MHHQGPESKLNKARGREMQRPDCPFPVFLFHSRAEKARVTFSGKSQMRGTCPLCFISPDRVQAYVNSLGQVKQQEDAKVGNSGSRFGLHSGMESDPSEDEENKGTRLDFEGLCLNKSSYEKDMSELWWLGKKEPEPRNTRIRNGFKIQVTPNLLWKCSHWSRTK